MAKELLAKPYYSADSITNNTIALGDAENCLFEPDGEGGLYLTRRPSITLRPEYTVSATVKEIIGLFYWKDATSIIAVVKHTSNLFGIESLQNGAAPFVYSTTLSATGLYVSFAPGEKLDGTKILYIGGVAPADTGFVCYIDTGFLRTVTSTTLSATPSGGSVAYINRRFITNLANSSSFIFTDTNPATGVLDVGFWDSSDNPLSCESRSDNLVALTVHWNEIYAWGSTSVEIWQDDGVTPFIPVRGAEIPFELLSPASIVEINDIIFAFGTYNSFPVVAAIKNRGLSIVSGPVVSLLRVYSTLSRIKATKMSTASSQLYVISFLRSGTNYSQTLTLVYNVTTDTWTNFTSATTNSRGAITTKYIDFMNTAYDPNTGLQLVSRQFDHNIFSIGTATSDATGVINVTRRTPWIDHGTWKRKRCNSLYLRIKRGQTSGVLRLRWVDNGSGTWSSYYDIKLSPTTDRDFISRNRRMGMYHSRRYEFTMSDNADFVLVGSDEDVTILRD